MWTEPLGETLLTENKKMRWQILRFSFLSEVPAWSTLKLWADDDDKESGMWLVTMLICWCLILDVKPWAGTAPPCIQCVCNEDIFVVHCGTRAVERLQSVQRWKSRCDYQHGGSSSDEQRAQTEPSVTHTQEQTLFTLFYTHWNTRVYLGEGRGARRYGQCGLLRSMHQ